MKEYIILIDCEEHCIDLHCKFSCVDNFWKVGITDPFDYTFIITGDNERQVYIETAKYILDKGKIVSIIPSIEKDPHNLLHTYIRLEQIKRHLSGLKRNFL